MVRTRYSFVGIAIVLSGAFGISGARADNSPSDMAIPSVLLKPWAHTREQYLAILFQPFRALSGRDQVLTEEDVALAGQAARAEARAQSLMRIITHDLNGDLVLTQDELRQSLNRIGSPTADENNGATKSILSADANSDGQITIDEALKNVESGKQRRGGNAETAVALMALDPNGDKRLTADELERIGRDAFAQFDADGDGVISKAEGLARTNKLRRVDGRREAERRDAEKALERCELPDSPEGTEIVIVGARRSGTFSTVATAGEDFTTETTELEIEAGETPLYVIALSPRPTVWRLTGATERVALLAVGPYYGGIAGVAVAGLPKERISFIPGKKCTGKLINAAIDRQDRLKQAVTVWLKRPVTAMIGGDVMVKAIVPSGAIYEKRVGTAVKQKSMAAFDEETRPQSVDPNTLKHLYLLRPGGIVDFDVKDLVAPGPVERYSILPEEAGLVQLMLDGFITRRDDGAYRINRPIERYPIELEGVHSVTFILPKGMPKPRNHPGDSLVISE